MALKLYHLKIPPLWFSPDKKSGGKRIEEDEGKGEGEGEEGREKIKKKSPTLASSKFVSFLKK